MLVSAGSISTTIQNNKFENMTEVADTPSIAVWLATDVSGVSVIENSISGFAVGIMTGLSKPAENLAIKDNTFVMDRHITESTAINVPSCTAMAVGGTDTIDLSEDDMSENQSLFESDRTVSGLIDMVGPSSAVTTCLAVGNTIINFETPFGPGITDGGGNIIQP